MDFGPALPADLEREIFEFAALSNLRSIVVLALVAKRVRSWIEPLLYKNLSVFNDDDRFRRGDGADVIRISTSDCLKVLESKSASFFHDHVRHLALTNILSDAGALILLRCTGVHRLAIFQTPPDSSWLPMIATMGVLQISMDINSLFGPSGVDFHHNIFARLTHLDLFELPTSKSWVADMCGLPCLTHLSFNFDSERRKNISATACQLILAECESLEALILIFSNPIDRSEFGGCQYFSDDPRSVTIVVDDFLEDWERGAIGRGDYWIKAERFIQKRRSGEIKGREYSIPVDWDPHS
ncbi:hypothetical protein MSAN_01065100 [Mycena sanguinolenta]|uniref:F-box domain-containing protein n=1 Tax=Mycena sanguinolenta TaxID=230812 RepID=A0A8H7D9Q4_9AGAR|nr:hypothetical protein MSAN_01065100 [Mycena sanguinolenta]